jgi:hypothetical protein
MAQQSARRGWENQRFPQCFEHALGDLDPARELCQEGASTEGEPSVPFWVRQVGSGHTRWCDWWVTDFQSLGSIAVEAIFTSTGAAPANTVVTPSRPVSTAGPLATR